MNGPKRSVVEQIWATFVGGKGFHGAENPLTEQDMVSHTDAARGPSPGGGADPSRREVRGAEITQSMNLLDLVLSDAAGTLKRTSWKVILCTEWGMFLETQKPRERGDFVMAFPKIIPSNTHWTRKRRECQ